MEETTKRPPIMNGNGKLSDNVKGLIVDREGQLIGVILISNDKLIIEFFGKTSPMIAYNKWSGEAEVLFEEFPADPRRILKKFIEARVKNG